MNNFLSDMQSLVLYRHITDLSKSKKDKNRSSEEQEIQLEMIKLKKAISSSPSPSNAPKLSYKDYSSSIAKINSPVINANEKIKSLFQFKIWNNYKYKQTKFDREYINENKEDYWEELVYDNPRIHTLYKDNIENELIKLDDLIPGEKQILNYSKMNLADILNINK